DLLHRPQQLTWSAWPVGLDDLVEKAGLVCKTPGRGFDDGALALDPHPSLTQPPPRRAEVARPRSEVGAEPEIDRGQRMWSATRTARTISRTSCTRTMSAPRSTAPTTV